MTVFDDAGVHIGYFGPARLGRVAVGQDADLAVLEGDPLSDVRQFAKVRCTIRGGMVIHGN